MLWNIIFIVYLWNKKKNSAQLYTVLFLKFFERLVWQKFSGMYSYHLNGLNVIISDKSADQSIKNKMDTLKFFVKLDILIKQGAKNSLKSPNKWPCRWSKKFLFSFSRRGSIPVTFGKKHGIFLFTSASLGFIWLEEGIEFLSNSEECLFRNSDMAFWISEYTSWGCSKRTSVLRGSNVKSNLFCGHSKNKANTGYIFWLLNTLNSKFMIFIKWDFFTSLRFT